MLMHEAKPVLKDRHALAGGGMLKGVKSALSGAYGIDSVLFVPAWL